MFKVIEFKNTHAWSGRRGHPAISAGTTLFAVQYQDRYFGYCYIYRESANRVCAMFNDKKHSQPFFDFNFKTDLQRLKHAVTLPEKISNV